MKKDYMTRLERAVRWRLPPLEAEDVITDYHDIVGTPPRLEEELLRDLGKPHDVAKLLAQPKQYHIWLTVFVFMTICILALVTDQLFVPVAFWVPFLFFHRIDIFFCYFLSGMGVIAALVWFRRQGRKAESLPKAIPILLAVFLVFIAAVVLFYEIAFRNPDAIYRIWDETLAAWFPDRSPFTLPAHVTCYICPLIVFIGVYSLIKARTGDRRWAAVYVLAMAVVLILRQILGWVHSMSLEITSYEAQYQMLMLRCAVTAAAGLIGTGVALC